MTENVLVAHCPDCPVIIKQKLFIILQKMSVFVQLHSDFTIEMYGFFLDDEKKELVAI